LRLNGKRGVCLQTRHGTFGFEEQQFLTQMAVSTSYLRQSGQQTVSVGLEEFCLFCCTRMSYETVAALLERMTGTALVCSQTLCHWVEAKARQYDALLVEQEAQQSETPSPEFMACADIYAKQSKEVVVFCDGICVKAQKPTHEKAGEPKRSKPDKRHDLDVFLCPKQDGGFAYLTASLDGRVSLVERTQRFLRQEWNRQETPLAMVALTDGARKIRQDLTAIFGAGVRVVLDWYHLAKRVYENLSMIAFSTSQREGLQERLLGLLWQGQISEAVAFVEQIAPRNKKAHADLVGYLQKHATEIIDYGRRQKVGKPIGSGRMEKAVDQVVGMRQKKKGMSWSAKGSHALALLKIAELNGHWKPLFAKA
jgi:hypothetical protein